MEVDMHPSKTAPVLDLAKTIGILRPRDLEGRGIPRNYLALLHHSGQLERVGRGLYRLPGKPVTTHHSLAEASKRVSGGVVCLLSALRFHDLTTQAPFEVWLAIANKARAPMPGIMPLRIVRFSAEALSEGIEIHDIEGVPVSIYCVAKTVADCFKYRNKIGLDVALEALRECRKKRKCTMDELWRYASICRVTNVMRPYLESVA